MSDEGIGGRKWSLERKEDGLHVMQGVTKICRLEPVDTAGKDIIDVQAAALEHHKLKMLLVTVPQLWAAANAVVLADAALDKALGRDSNLAQLEGATKTFHEAVYALGEMVAKAVGKAAWKDVAQ